MGVRIAIDCMGGDHGPAVTIAGYLWATRFASRYELLAESAVSYEELLEKFKNLPSATAAFTPLVLPIVLIALKSVANFPSLPFGSGTLKIAIDFIGEPMVALLFGLVACLAMLAPAAAIEGQCAVQPPGYERRQRE